MILTLIDKKQETPDCISFILQPDQPFLWRAGQFLYYTLPHSDPDNRGEKRFFTIASAPFEQKVRITTRFAPEKGSSFKHNLHNLQIGQMIKATGPNGSFVVDDPHLKYVFIAGGIGITPFRAILLDLNYQHLPLNVTLLYANRNDQIVYQAELEDLAKSHLEFKPHFIIDPQKIDNELIRSTVEGLNDKQFYLSGPQPFVEAMEKTLAELGVAKEQIKTDYFPGYQSH